MVFVDPKNDVAFRKIFGSENKKKILISFLNNILGFAGTAGEIVDIFIQNPYQVPKLEGLKETILDIKAVDKRNIHYIIEMQVFHTSAFEKRVQYYVSKAYSGQLESGENYPKLNQVIFLGFLDFTLFKEVPGYASRHLILEENSNGHYLKDLQFNFVELPKFTLTLEQLTNVKEKWIYFVKNADKMTMIPKQLEEPAELKEAFDVANQMSWSKEELQAYDTRGVLIQDERGRVEYALEEGLRKGEMIGIQKGEEIGIRKGEEIGLKKGKDLGIKEGKQDIARSMLQDGMDPETVSKFTGLAVAEINEL